ncbi:MAG: hybrid sensor histidine kinase/response regulator [Paludibacter sp.]|jgi:two-component system sensor histidine kinase/response regulator|nr:hybrid sensor histidine kinase/response regulator [Paludibacter sp.]
MNHQNLTTPIYDILIADDAPANLKVLSEILRLEGYKVRPVLNGTQALEAAELMEPDLILLDIMMPDINGYEVCKQLKSNPKLKEIPVIFISALSDTDSVIQAFAVGGVDYVTKPFKAEEVKVRVSTHLKIRMQSKELQQLNTTKDKLFSIISHDLRGPFGNFSQVLDLLSEDLEFSDPVKMRLFDELRTTSKSVMYLLDNLLNWSRSQSKRLSIDPQDVIINLAVMESIRLLKPVANAKNISLDFLADNVYTVFVDTNSLSLIFRNLVSNAIKFTNPGGKIVVSVALDEKDSSMVRVSVTDNGIGMNEEVVARLFRQGQHFTTYGTNNEKGSGLGLLLVNDFVAYNHGVLSVESKEGEGTTFSFTLPASGK